MSLEIKREGIDAEKVKQLEAATAAAGMEALFCGKGEIARPTTGPHDGTRRMYLGITETHQKRLGIEKVGDSIAVQFIEGSSPPRFTLYLVSLLVDDETFLEHASQDKLPGVNLNDAQAITAALPIRGESISMPTETEDLGHETAYAILQTSTLKDPIQSLLQARDYRQYPEELRQKWEAGNRERLPIIVVPTPVARLLGNVPTSTRSIPGGRGSTIVEGKKCTLRYGNGKTRDVFICGALNCFGVDAEFGREIGISFGQELPVTIVPGENGELAVENTVESIAGGVAADVEHQGKE